MDLAVFIFGCLGAASPECVRLYKLRNRQVTFSKTYFLISIVFFLLGGIVALALPSTTLWGAFYSGLTLPMLISGALGKKSKSQEKETSGFSGLGLLVKKTLTAREFLGVIFS